MSIAQVVVFFLIFWWAVFLVCLPFGIEREEAPEPGMDPGAPKSPRLGIKAAIATGVTIVVTTAVYYAANAGLLPIEAWLSGG
jgi:predicted secreted protein